MGKEKRCSHSRSRTWQKRCREKDEMLDSIERLERDLKLTDSLSSRHSSRLTTPGRKRNYSDSDSD